MFTTLIAGDYFRFCMDIMRRIEARIFGQGCAEFSAKSDILYP